MFCEQDIKDCKFVSVHAKKAHGGEKVWFRPFLASELDRGEWSTSHLGRFTPGSYWIGGWVGPGDALGGCGQEKPRCWDSKPGPSSP